MTTQHTPSPWAWHSRSEDQAHNGAVYHLKREGHAYAVAMQPQYVSAEQWEADASLIAAAPELLEALIAARSLLDKTMSPNACAMADAAIAKATRNRIE